MLVPGWMKGAMRLRTALIVASAASALTACAYNPELGRSQLLFGGEQQMAQMAQGAWADIKQKQKVSTDPRYTGRLDRVAPRLIRAAGGDPAEWEYLVFEDPSLNAFALPGGKIGIHTGIMDIMENDAQLATVVGHEIAHVNYNHSGERYSQNLATQIGLVGAQIGLGAACSGGTARERNACQQNTAMAAQALGAGAIYGLILPYSRKHELEADAGGIRYMAQAGYDPAESLEFWQKMAAASEGQARPPEFASTHPATGTRIDFLRAEIARVKSGQASLTPVPTTQPAFQPQTRATVAPSRVQGSSGLDR